MKFTTSFWRCSLAMPYLFAVASTSRGAGRTHPPGGLVVTTHPFAKLAQSRTVPPNVSHERFRELSRDFPIGVTTFEPMQPASIGTPLMEHVPAFVYHPSTNRLCDLPFRT